MIEDNLNSRNCLNNIIKYKNNIMERKKLQLPGPIIRLFARLAKCDPAEISKEIFSQEIQICSNIPSGKLK